MPITEPLDEATNDFFRAFNMYITSEIDGIKEIEKKVAFTKWLVILS